MLRRILVPLLVALLAVPSTATWSIVVVNRRTGEVGVAAATCLPQTDLLLGLPVIDVGRGAGVIQASGDPRLLPVIFDGLREGLVPDDIMAITLAAADRPRQHQIGIVSMEGRPATFTGRGAGAAKGGIIGEVGDLAYAIQGNVLTGSGVWLEAEKALLGPGDLGQKLMRAMEAAREQGGDGRCSCPIGEPSNCGSPPEDEFDKSAHCGFLVVARRGDQNSPCTKQTNCASGSYYLRLNIRGLNAAMGKPDPVLQLRERYDEWRAAHVGRPDGLLSTVEAVQALPADGLTTGRVTIRLRDVDGTPLTRGGADVRLRAIGGTSIATPGPIADHGDGTYSFDLTAGDEEGLDRFIVTAVQGGVKATLFPFLEVRSDARRPLHAGFDSISSAAGAEVPFVVDVPERPEAYYMILGSMSGTEPGIGFGPFSLPLNPDRLTLTTLVHGGRSDLLPGTIGRLDELGRARAALTAEPELLFSLIGLRLDWAAVVLGQGWPLGTNAVGFDVLP